MRYEETRNSHASVTTRGSSEGQPMSEEAELHDLMTHYSCVETEMQEAQQEQESIKACQSHVVYTCHAH